jgi:hypothetical protein
MINWKLPVALFIGGIFVYLTNKKTKKKLQDDFQHTQKATKKKDENIY